ncbi:MAG: hypothetical protein DI539_04830 [Flavobacterium psychrophilum]|nr:MAG: hypothetical protein DI539_04830 [Flavobacterium psychrophilum]
MESIYNPKDNQNIINRIETLTPITLSQWGKMTVSQMLLHCQMPIKVAFGTLTVKPQPVLSFLFGKSAKKKLTSNQPFGKGSPTAKEFVITHEPDFEKSKRELIELVAVFAKEGHTAIKLEKHPFFGHMTPHEWDLLQWKHLDHHLKQFGA